MTPMEFIQLLDHNLVEELTMYYCGHKSVVKLNELPAVMPNYPIKKIWNSENGKGISIVMDDIPEDK